MGGLRSLHNQTGLQKTLHQGINVVSPNNSGLSGDNWIQDRPAHIVCQEEKKCIHCFEEILMGHYYK